MCGIVGVAGRANAETVLIEGLRRLEYRGYDSAGLGVHCSDGRLRRARAPGKVSALETVMRPEVSGSTGIAHTRWATHVFVWSTMAL
jgi:glucosamine--fructose-6-phosphate aminotransferase (isomerizing)